MRDMVCRVYLDLCADFYLHVLPGGLQKVLAISDKASRYITVCVVGKKIPFIAPETFSTSALLLYEIFQHPSVPLSDSRALVSFSVSTLMTVTDQT